MNQIKAIILSLMAAVMCSSFVMAEEFTPLNFEDATYTSSAKLAATTESTTTKATTAQTVSDTTGSKNMQSAISQLDNAQVEVRNELLNYKSKFAEVDARYNTVKNERANLSKQIKSCEKKINQLDKAKEKIRRNMV